MGWLISFFCRRVDDSQSKLAFVFDVLLLLYMFASAPFSFAPWPSERHSSPMFITHFAFRSSIFLPLTVITPFDAFLFVSFSRSHRAHFVPPAH